MTAGRKSQDSSNLANCSTGVLLGLTLSYRYVRLSPPLCSS
jgi:hypothetical protein